MGTTLSKTQLLTELRTEQADWEALLDEIGQAHMTQPEVAGGWSIKDIVAHLTGWRRRSVRRFQALLHHEPDFSPPWPPELREDDEINAWMYESNRDRPLAEVLSESREVFLRQMVAAVRDPDRRAPVEEVGEVVRAVAGECGAQVGERGEQCFDLLRLRLVYPL